MTAGNLLCVGSSQASLYKTTKHSTLQFDEWEPDTLGGGEGIPEAALVTSVQPSLWHLDTQGASR